MKEKSVVLTSRQRFALAAVSGVGLATLRRFLKGEPVRSETGARIAKALVELGWIECAASNNNAPGGQP